MDRDFWRGRRVFITGISGFVGSHLAEKLLEMGCQVSGLVRRHSVSGYPNLEKVLDSVNLYENSRNPFPERREWVNNCLSLAKYTKQVNEEIRAKARELEKQGLRSMDALHLACAEAAGVDYFLTCDDKVVRRYKGKKMKVINPIEFILIMTTQG